MPKLRVVFDASHGGPWNMAADVVLARRAAASGQTTLRFYGWTPATLSLGYFQSYRERDRHTASAGCPWVRRPSGGGAIVHDQELTYSLLVPAGAPLSNRPADLYNLVHQALIDTLGQWNIACELCPATVPKPARDEPFLCFARRAAGDVLLAGQKIAGSAQRRLAGVVMQHGSVLVERSAAAPELPGINDLQPHRCDHNALAAAWLKPLAQALDLQPVNGPMYADEDAEIKALAASQFGSSDWNFRR